MKMNAPPQFARATGISSAGRLPYKMIGRLLDALDKSGRAENTIIVLWSDHGYHLGDKESCVKFTLWEKANRVPFIIVAPGVTKPGSVCDAPVTLLNIYPTLLELCGFPPKPDNDGHSLVSLLKNPEADWPHPAIMTQGEGNHALRTDRWRYIRYRDGSEELYDHENDPWEWKNLAGDEAHGDVMGDLRSKLDKATRKPPRASESSERPSRQAEDAGQGRVRRGPCSAGRTAMMKTARQPEKPNGHHN